MSFGVWKWLHNRDTFRLIPSKIVRLVVRRCTSTSESSYTVQVWSKAAIFGLKCVKISLMQKYSPFWKGSIHNLPKHTPDTAKCYTIHMKCMVYHFAVCTKRLGYTLEPNCPTATTGWVKVGGTCWNKLGYKTRQHWFWYSFHQFTFDS